MSSTHLEKMASVSPAKIEWRDGLPYSLEFDDVYYSVHGALEESSHVFIEGNQLKSDWLNRANDINSNENRQSEFRIAELGFGSGLNFLNTAQHWQQHLRENPCNQSLHYIAIEKRPFSLEDFKRSCQPWQQFNQTSQFLANHYPTTIYGRYQIYFPFCRLTLTLFFMPIDEALDELILESGQQAFFINHWYLDGFAPTKNSSMWGQENANKIARLSKKGTRLATYSVSGIVKRPLIEAGFEITKRKGFAKKREMLTAILNQTAIQKKQPKFINLKYESPWFNWQPVASHSPSSKKENAKIAIIGAGLAGCTMAYTLTQLGYSVELYEQRDQIASAASGAAAGIFHPQLTQDFNLSSQFNWQAYLVLVSFLSSLSSEEKNRVILNRGIERFFKDQNTAEQLLKLSQKLNIEQWIQASQIFPNSERCISFPQAATIDIKAFCTLLLNKIPANQLSIKTKAKVTDINFKDHHEINNQWTVEHSGSCSSYAQIIFCGGANSHLLKQLHLTHTHISRGQTCFFNSKKLSSQLKNTVMEKIYMVPLDNHQFQLGTTFENIINDDLSHTSQTSMLRQASVFLKELRLPFLTEQEINQIPLKGTMGYRLHTRDRLPLVGAAFDHNKLQQDFTQLGQRRILRNSLSHYNLPGLWINTAYGSHGLLFSLLASQQIASLMSNSISPLSPSISRALNPVRFAIQALKQGN